MAKLAYLLSKMDECKQLLKAYENDPAHYKYVADQVDWIASAIRQIMRSHMGV